MSRGSTIALDDNVASSAVDATRGGARAPAAPPSDPDLEDGLAHVAEGYVPGSAAEKRLVRKIDMLLMPLLWWLYVLAQIDRSNVANANAAGLSEDLGFSDSDYAIVVSIFFIGYAIFEVPSNLLLTKLRPSLYLSGVMAVWGTCVAAMSASQTAGHFLAARFFLGCIEAGAFPGALYLLTCWYKKDEVGKRFAIFATSGTFSSALGGIMAGAVISGLDGKLGWHGWRWLFLIEGVATVFFAGIFAVALVDYPLTTTTFFTPEERQLAFVRVQHSRGKDAALRAAAGKLTPWQSLLAVAADARTYAFLVLYVVVSTAQSISYFIPTTLRAMGYTQVTAQWMTVPIWLSGAAVMVLVSFSSDKTGDRRWHTTGLLAAALACCIVCLLTYEAKTRYAILCLFVGALWTAAPAILNWASEEMGLPDQKRSVALALINSSGSLSIIWGSRLWPAAESPRHQTGFTAVAAMAGIGALLAVAMPMGFRLLPDVPATKAERDLIESSRNEN